jgi:hypothetical protein
MLQIRVYDAEAKRSDDIVLATGVEEIGDPTVRDGVRGQARVSLFCT